MLVLALKLFMSSFVHQYMKRYKKIVIE